MHVSKTDVVETVVCIVEMRFDVTSILKVG